MTTLHTFHEKDRVRVNNPQSGIHNQVGTIILIEHDGEVFRLDMDFEGGLYAVPAKFIEPLGDASDLRDILIEMTWLLKRLHGYTVNDWNDPEVLALIRVIGNDTYFKDILPFYVRGAKRD